MSSPRQRAGSLKRQPRKSLTGKLRQQRGGKSAASDENEEEPFEFDMHATHRMRPPSPTPQGEGASSPLSMSDLMAHNDNGGESYSSLKSAGKSAMGELVDDTATATTEVTIGGHHALTLRLALIQFFVCYSPDRLVEIPMLLRKYVNRETELKLQLRREYNQVPMEKEAVLVMKLDHRTRMMVFFAHYNPSKVPDGVDALLSKYWGQESELWAALEAKYGPEPDLHKLHLDVEAAIEEEQKRTAQDGGAGGLGPLNRSSSKSAMAMSASSPTTTGGLQQQGGDSQSNAALSKRQRGKSVRFGGSPTIEPSASFDGVDPSGSVMMIDGIPFVESMSYDPQAPPSSVKRAAAAGVPQLTSPRSAVKPQPAVPAGGEYDGEEPYSPWDGAFSPRGSSASLLPPSQAANERSLPPLPAASPTRALNFSTAADTSTSQPPPGSSGLPPLPPRVGSSAAAEPHDMGAMYMSMMQKLGVDLYNAQPSTLYLASTAAKRRSASASPEGRPPLSAHSDPTGMLALEMLGDRMASGLQKPPPASSTQSFSSYTPSGAYVGPPPAQRSSMSSLVAPEDFDAL